MKSFKKLIAEANQTTDNNPEIKKVIKAISKLNVDGITFKVTNNENLFNVEAIDNDYKQVSGGMTTALGSRTMQGQDLDAHNKKVKFALLDAFRALRRSRIEFEDLWGGDGKEVGGVLAKYYK